MSGCHNWPQDASQLTSHAHSRDRFSKMFQSYPRLDPKLFRRTKFFSSEQVRMSGCRNQPQDTSQLTSHAHGMVNQSKSCKSNPSLHSNYLEGQIFCMTASLNVWVSQPASRYITTDIACTRQGQILEDVPILPTSGSDIRLFRTKDKIFLIGSSSNVWVSHQATRYNPRDSV